MTSNSEWSRAKSTQDLQHLLTDSDHTKTREAKEGEEREGGRPLTHNRGSPCGQPRLLGNRLPSPFQTLPLSPFHSVSGVLDRARGYIRFCFVAEFTLSKMTRYLSSLIQQVSNQLRSRDEREVLRLFKTLIHLLWFPINECPPVHALPLFHPYCGREVFAGMERGDEYCEGSLRLSPKGSERVWWLERSDERPWRVERVPDRSDSETRECVERREFLWMDNTLLLIDSMQWERRRSDEKGRKGDRDTHDISTTTHSHKRPWKAL